MEMKFLSNILLSLSLFTLTLTTFCAENGKDTQQGQSLLTSIAGSIAGLFGSNQPKKEIDQKLKEELTYKLFATLNHPDTSPANLAQAQSLLEAGADHETFRWGTSNHDLFTLAIDKGLPYVKLFIEHQKKIDPQKLKEYLNKQGNYTSCPLIEACRLPINRLNSKAPEMPEQELRGIIRLLLDEGADPNCQIYAHLRKGRALLTPLICLLTNARSFYGAFDSFNIFSSDSYCHALDEILKHKNTNINQPDFNYDDDCTILDWDERCKNRTRHNITPLMHVVETAIQFEQTQDTFAIYNQQRKVADKQQAAAKRAANPFLPIIELLLKYGADTTLKDYQGNTALDYAPFQGHNKDAIREIRWLLTGNYKTRDAIQETAQLPGVLARLCVDYLVGQENDQSILDIIDKATKETEEIACIELEKKFKQGASADSCNDNGKTALMYAAQYGHENIVRVLLAHEKSPACTTNKENNGKTALTYAARQGSPTIVRTILQATPADKRTALVNEKTVIVRKIDPYGENYIKRSKTNKPQMAVNYIKRSKTQQQEPATVEISTEIVGQTALHVAAQKGYAHIVQLLIDAGADITIKDTAQKTALDYALNDEIRKLLSAKN